MTDFSIPVVGVIGYRTGNSRSVGRALDFLGVPNRMLRVPGDLAGVDRVVLPGVGSAGTTMRYLAAAGWPAVLRSLVADGDMPFLGVCVGLQVLYEASEEQDALCLGWLPGKVRSFGGGVRVPQIGWNQVRAAGPGHPFTRGLPGSGDFYFVNSYFAPPGGPEVAATAEYGTPFAAVVARRNIMATQFHCEKSGPAGLGLLKTFTGLTREELCR
jgi:glutamine amidotransferase